LNGNSRIIIEEVAHVVKDGVMGAKYYRQEIKCCNINGLKQNFRKLFREKQQIEKSIDILLGIWLICVKKIDEYLLPYFRREDVLTATTCNRDFHFRYFVAVIAFDSLAFSFG
jgi:hypothetical protein